ncbi:MAG: dTDP-glucose 4,6-dehydratase [Patescibacteria group bacterium]|jgi:dTDP-glucose 4,6-dehydratase|nr:dTDP-glucose 4,6-dehydratase [Patescibacteria group bacterium]
MNYEKKILITGGAGFIGSNFLNLCVPKYDKYLFINIDSLTNSSNINNISVGNKANYIFKEVDIRDISNLEGIFTDFDITDVIHFAAESHVDVSIENPKIFIETNIIGTHNLLNLSLKYNIKRFYQVSTDEVYGSLEINEKPFTSLSSLSPNNPYSASKASGDLLVRAYNKTFGLNTIISRCTNNYGPNQDDSKLIPKFIKCLLRGEKVPLYAKGENIRDWIYVEDHVEAIDTIFHKGTSGSVYNIGSNNEMTNYDIVENLLKLSKRDESSIEYVSDRIGHDFRYAVNTEDLFKELGWKARTSFKQGIEKTFEFYKNEI